MLQPRFLLAQLLPLFNGESLSFARFWKFGLSTPSTPTCRIKRLVRPFLSECRYILAWGFRPVSL